MPKCDGSRGQLCLQRSRQASGYGTQAVTGIPYAAWHIPDAVHERAALCLSPLCPAAPPLVLLAGKDVFACTQGMSVQELYFLHVKKKKSFSVLEIMLGLRISSGLSNKDLNSQGTASVTGCELHGL